MATAAVQSVEHTVESLKKLTVDSQAKLAEASDPKNQPLSTQSADVEISDQTPGAVGLVYSVEGSSGPGPQNTAVETNMFYGQNSYPPPTYYYEGYDSPAPEWEEYPRYVNIDGMEIPSSGVYSENGSVLYHAGYAYAPQMAYGPYSPAGTPFPSIRADSQLYGTRHLYTGPFYQQAVPPGVQYISSATPMSQAELSTSVGAEQSTFHGCDGSSANFVNENGVLMPPPRPGYSVPYGSVGRGVLHVTNTSPGYQDPRQGCDGIRPSGSWFDSKNDSEGQQRSTSTSVPAFISQQAQALGPFGQNIRRVMGVQQPRPLSGIATAPTFNRVCSPNKIYPHSNNSGRQMNETANEETDDEYFDESCREFHAEKQVLAYDTHVSSALQVDHFELKHGQSTNKSQSVKMTVGTNILVRYTVFSYVPGIKIALDCCKSCSAVPLPSTALSDCPCATFNKIQQLLNSRRGQLFIKRCVRSKGQPLWPNVDSPRLSEIKFVAESICVTSEVYAHKLGIDSKIRAEVWPFLLGCCPRTFHKLSYNHALHLLNQRHNASDPTNEDLYNVTALLAAPWNRNRCTNVQNYSDGVVEVVTICTCRLHNLHETSIRCAGINKLPHRLLQPSVESVTSGCVVQKLLTRAQPFTIVHDSELEYGWILPLTYKLYISAENVDMNSNLNALM